MARQQQIFWLLILSLLLTGCGTPRTFVAPVDNRTHIAGEIPKTYTVRTGDSLYMIAMEFELDHLDIAKWNGIRAPYTIHKGQVLRLHPVQKKHASSPAVSSGCSGSYYTVQRGDTLSEVAEKCRVQTRTLAQWNRLRAPYTIHVGQKLRLKPASVTPQTVSRSQPKPKATTAASSSRSSSSFRRPVSGKITQYFSSKKGNTGIEFSGRKGDSVRAAGDGKVVYSGTGLVRYGKLLIIKHDNNLLTAYAHNSELQVAEGDLVKAGQQIAKMGSSGTDKVKLHFEVRKGGKPVDPMRYLGK